MKKRSSKGLLLRLVLAVALLGGLFVFLKMRNNNSSSYGADDSPSTTAAVKLDGTGSEGESESLQPAEGLIYELNDDGASYSVTGIGDNTKEAVRYIIIPDSVTTISVSLFSGCRSLTSITIPKSVTSIAKWVFDGCEDLAHVYYSGTEAEWSAITIDEDGMLNSDLFEATCYYYSEAQPAEAGNYWHYVDGVATAW